MVFRLDILMEDGFSRLCNLSSKQLGLKIRTPTAIVPITDFLVEHQAYQTLAQGENLIFKVTNPDQEIPAELKNHFILCNLDTNYYTSEYLPESYLPKTISENMCYFFSKQCPSTFLNDEFAQEWYKVFFDEIVAEINAHPKVIQDINGFGITLNLNNIKDPQIILSLCIQFLAHPQIYDQLLAVEFRGLFDSKMDYVTNVDFFLKLKPYFPADVLFIASGNIKPYEYSFLIYIGFDLIDFTYLLHAGFSGLYYHHEEEMEWIRKLPSIDDFACSCKYCSKISDIFFEHPSSPPVFDDPPLFSAIAFHNSQMGMIEIARIRKNIQQGSLSTYLERKSQFSLFLLSAVRHLQKQYGTAFLEVQNLNKNTLLPCTSSLSYHNPNVEKFKRTVIRNVEPNPNTKICIFLPCSMVKPYSKSKSHRNFRKTIRNATKRWYKCVSEVIITSPIGLVPRELEEVFPAAHYDISVTGDWDAEELTLTAESIVQWIKKLPFSVILIAFLHGGYQQAFELAMQKLNQHTADKFNFIIVNSNEDLDRTLQETIKRFETQNAFKLDEDFLTLEEQSIKVIADFQFGLGAGKRLIGSSARFLVSRNELYKSIVGNESYGKLQLGRYFRNSGHIQLNYQGGERLKDFTECSVVLNTLDITGTTIFKPGIDHIAEKLCAGDEVVILGPNKQYLGVGSLIANSNTILKMRRGAVVKVRKMNKGD